MYGLTHRLSINSTTPEIVESGPLAPVIALRAGGTVMVIDRDPFTLQLVRLSVGEDFHVVVARDADEAMMLMHSTRPDVGVFDTGLEETEIAMVTVALAACEDMDATPTIMLNPDEAMNADSMRARIDAALSVSRRVYLGGGLRNRVAV
jgi:DNA-binding NarL/FixJ family response regulator